MSLGAIRIVSKDYRKRYRVRCLELMDHLPEQCLMTDESGHVTQACASDDDCRSRTLRDVMSKERT